MLDRLKFLESTSASLRHPVTVRSQWKRKILVAAALNRRVIEPKYATDE
jgi:hypothetical protein